MKRIINIKMYLVALMISVPLLLMIYAFGPNNEEPELKKVFDNFFFIGAAVDSVLLYGGDEKGVELVDGHFNSITSENLFKWERIHPAEGTYNFEPADKFIEFGSSRDMFIVGHTLIWHNQTPDWVFRDVKGNLLDKASLLNRMRDHIRSVVGRYKGKIHGWDVVNEALEEDGSMRQSLWYKIIGEDYVAKAFEFASEADPAAELYYNDFSLENKPKRSGAVDLIKSLQAKGIEVSEVGLQGHYKMDWPSTVQIDSTIDAFAQLGVKVSITELDVDVLPYENISAEITYEAEARKEIDPYADGLPDSVQTALAERYKELFKVFIDNNDEVERVTFWGVHDKGSWLNNWPVKGRTSYPLLFDREGKTKPAFHSIINEAMHKAIN